MGRATVKDDGGEYTKEISIHALRGEGDAQADKIVQRYTAISIHALRGEGDA